MNKTERCVGYYLDEKDANPAFRPDSASLEDGSVLKALLENSTADATTRRCMRLCAVCATPFCMSKAT